MPLVAHISDLHLQSGVPARQAQIEPVLKAVNDAKPDLVVISGDVTDDGWDSIDELRWARQWLDERCGLPMMVLPGNHDTGNFIASPLGPIQQHRATQWREVFETPAVEKINGWSIIGLDSMVFGSGFAAEQQQTDWLAEQLGQSKTNGEHTAVFLHSPLFIQSPQEPDGNDTAYWLGPRPPRQTLWEFLNGIGVKLIGSGHVHQTRLMETDGVQIAWAPPASGTWVHAPGLPNPPMPEHTGFFLHELHDDGRARSHLIKAAAMLKCFEVKP